MVFSQRIEGLRKGEQLQVEAAAFTSIAGLPYATVTTAHVILAESPRAPDTGPVSQRLGGRGEITEANGFICTRNRPVCVSRKAGVLKVRRDARSSSGRPVPVYVNVVMSVGPKRQPARPGDRQEILPRGGLSVTRYAPPGDRASERASYARLGAQPQPDLWTVPERVAAADPAGARGSSVSRAPARIR